MAGRALLSDRLVGKFGLENDLFFLVTGKAQGLRRGSEEKLVRGGMGIMTANALFCHEGAMEVFMLDLVIPVAGDAELCRGRAAFELKFIRGLVGIVTARTLLGLHRCMDDLLIIEGLLVFMACQAEVFAGPGQAKRSPGSFDIMADLTGGCPHRAVDILSPAHLSVALI